MPVRRLPTPHLNQKAGSTINNEGRLKSPATNHDRLTDELARRVMRWRPVPGRYIKAGRSWIPRRRFQPLANLDHAFQLLDTAAATYSITFAAAGGFSAQVQIGDRRGSALGEPKALAITIALCRALGMDV
jgi:hypothetical protein